METQKITMAFLKAMNRLELEQQLLIQKLSKQEVADKKLYLIWIEAAALALLKVHNHKVQLSKWASLIKTIILHSKK